MAAAEGDGEVDLCLELSIGGRSAGRKAAAGYAGVVPQRSRDLEGIQSEGGAVDGLRGVVASAVMPALMCVDGGDAADPLRRREMHAMRRQEARKKREEKQQKKGIGPGKNVASGGGRGHVIAVGGAAGVGCHRLPGPTCSPEDWLALEAHEYQLRARDREARESEACRSDRKGAESGHKTLSRASSFSSNTNPKQSPIPNSSPNAIPNGNHPLDPYGPCPVIPMPYPFHPAHFVPFPYMMPYWNPQVASGVDGSVREKNGVLQPLPCRAFRPFQPPPASKNGVPQGACEGTEINGGESNGGNGASIKRTPSLTASQGSSFSAISEYQSGSLQGGSSSTDARSQSSDEPVQEPQPRPLSAALTNRGAHSDHSISSNQTDKETTKKLTGEPAGNEPGLDSAKSSPNPPVEGNQTDKPLADSNPNKAQNQLLPQMPCVSTTGDGPNGKTITGLLYRYNEKEVSIRCLCHGSSFTPAEFIKHAGGTEIECPLKHILVVTP